METTHAVVEFTDENSVTVVPCCWLTDDKCSYWPPYTIQESIDNAVKGAVRPKQTWPKYPIRVLFLSYKFSQTTTPSRERSSIVQTKSHKTNTIGRSNDNDVHEGNYTPPGCRGMTTKPVVHPIAQAIPKRATYMNQSICSESGHGTVDSNALRKIVELLTQLNASVNTLVEQVRANTMAVQLMTSSTTAEIPDDLNMELPIAYQQELDFVEEELTQN